MPVCPPRNTQGDKPGDARPFLDNWRAAPSLKADLHRLFLDSEQIARSFASADRWVPIRQVVAGNANGWSTDGTIQIVPSADNKGILFHEVFHSAFHRSDLHAGNDERWGNAFCDGFRYFMEEEHLSAEPSPWLDKIRRYVKMTPEGIEAQSEHRDHDRRYAIPATLIIQHSKDLKGFRQLWEEFNRRRASDQADVCEGYFSYTIPP